MNISRIIFALCVNVFFTAATYADNAAGASPQKIASIKALAPRVEEIVASTKPASWAVRHSCLYHAMVGRHLLARQGIVSRLVTGAVVYYPYRPGYHKINPHAWLETGSHLIDYSTLPRWGDVTVIPLNTVARHYREIKPAGTRILTIRRPKDPELMRYLVTHRARFERALKELNED